MLINIYLLSPSGIKNRPAMFSLPSYSPPVHLGSAWTGGYFFCSSPCLDPWPPTSMPFSGLLPLSGRVFSSHHTLWPPRRSSFYPGVESYCKIFVAHSPAVDSRGHKLHNCDFHTRFVAPNSAYAECGCRGVKLPAPSLTSSSDKWNNCHSFSW